MVMASDSDCWQGERPGRPGDECWSIEDRRCIEDGRAL